MKRGTLSIERQLDKNCKDNYFCDNSSMDKEKGNCE